MGALQSSNGLSAKRSRVEARVPRKRSDRPNWFARVQIRRGLPGVTELYDLEALSSATFQQWQAHGKAQSEYQYRLYFDLETQRAAHKAEPCQALRDSASVTLNIDGWWRVIDFSYCMHALSPAGSLQWVGGRFNYGNDIDSTRFPPFPALYLAEDFTTAFRERFGLAANDDSRGLEAHELVLADASSWSSLKLTGVVNNVFDLTRLVNLKGFCRVIGKFSLSRAVYEAEAKAMRAPTRLVRKPRELLDSLMRDDWRALPVHFDVPSNSQVFGRLLVDAGFDGVVYRSSKSGHRCLAVFTRQLVNSDSKIALHGDRPAGIAFAELTAANCLEV
jgi:hypothetical protein